MQGSVIIDFGNGWACSNEASVVVERNIIEGPNGQKLSKHTNTIRVLYYLNIIGEMVKDVEAEVVFKMDESGTEKGFKTKIVGLTEEMAILEVIEHIENYKSITKKIKGGYNYGK